MLLSSVALIASILAESSRPPGLVAAITQDKTVDDCAKESGKSPQAYVFEAFDLRRVRLHGGEQMIVATATDPCLALGQSTRIMIFQNTSDRYQRVLDDVTLPGLARVGSDGTVMLPTHESMDVIFEASYLWNGASYVFAPLRSHRYDVALGERRPYEVALRLVRGATATTLSGTTAYNFGEDYVFEATAGAILTIDFMKQSGIPPGVSLYYDDEMSSVVKLHAFGNWAGKLRRSGTYRLLVSGGDESNETRLSRYVIQLSAR